MLFLVIPPVVNSPRHVPSDPIKSIAFRSLSTSLAFVPAFKYVDDAAMGVDLTVKQMLHVLRGRQKLLAWLGLGHEPKRRGRIRNFFFRVGVTNKWRRIVLSYRVRVRSQRLGPKRSEAAVALFRGDCLVRSTAGGQRCTTSGKCFIADATP